MGGTKNTLSFCAFVMRRGRERDGGGAGNNLQKQANNNGALERAFSITLAEILKLYGQAGRIIINFQVINKHKH